MSDENMLDVSDLLLEPPEKDHWVVEEVRERVMKWNAETKALMEWWLINAEGVDEPIWIKKSDMITTWDRELPELTYEVMWWQRQGVTRAKVKWAGYPGYTTEPIEYVQHLPSLERRDN